MTRLTRLLSTGLAAVITSAFAVIAIATPAHAEVTCNNRIEWYQNRYEVVATEVVECNTTSWLIVADIAIYKIGGQYVWLEVSKGCVVERTCSATTYTTNRSGLEQYCAEARGSYQYQSGNPALNSRPLPGRASCITA